MASPTPAPAPVPAALGGIKTKANAYLSTDIAPLQQLDQKIQSDAAGKQAAQDFSTIVSDYRVYSLVVPASRIAADAAVQPPCDRG